MHELSVVENIIDLVQQKSTQDKFTQVKKIILEVGELSCISIEALEFCFDVSCKNTVLQNSILEIINIPGVGYCENCEQKIDYKNLYDPCYICGLYNIKKVSGFDMRVKSILVE